MITQSSSYAFGIFPGSQIRRPVEAMAAPATNPRVNSTLTERDQPTTPGPQTKSPRRHPVPEAVRPLLDLDGATPPALIVYLDCARRRH
jgi:hypothetical protein